MQHGLARRLRGAGVLTIALLLVQCTDRMPSAPEREIEPPPTMLTAVSCSGSVAGATLRCTASPSAMSALHVPLRVQGQFSTADHGGPMTHSIILGGQGTFVQLSSGAITVNAGVFTVPVTLQNLIGQALGTEDGATPAAEGVRVFFVQEPTVTGGTGTMELHPDDVDGEATFTASDQKYYQYDEVLQTNDVSGARPWSFRFTGEPTFEFRVYVWAPVRFPDGWVDVTPASAAVPAGGTQQLNAVVRDRVGTPVDGAAVVWSTSDSDVATVDASGLATGVAAGTAAIAGTSDGTVDGSERRGSSAVTVGSAPQANASAYEVERDGALVRDAAAGLLSNDDLGSPEATLTGFGGGDLGGTADGNAAGTTVSPLPSHGSGSITVNSDGSFSLTPATGYSGSYTFDYVIGNTFGSSTGSVTLNVLAANDATYPETVVGNVSVNSANVTVPFSVTANDHLPADADITFAGWNATADVTEQGGNLTMQKTGTARGLFTYNPPAGFTGTDRFTYTVDADGIELTANVTLTVAGMIWFVQRSPTPCTAVSAGCGRLSQPFHSLGAFNAANTGTGRNPANDHSIFLYHGNYPGPVLLRDGQRLIGRNASASLAARSGLTPGSGSTALPAMGQATNITMSSGGVSLGSGNLLSGFTIATSDGTALGGFNFGTLTLADDFVLAPTGGTPLALNNGTVTAALAGIGSGTGISLTGVNGSLSMAGGSLANTTGTAFAVDGGNATITYGGTISSSGSGRPVSIANRSTGAIALSGSISSTGLGIAVQNNSGGSVTFSGSSKSLSTGGSQAVALSNNPNASINFTGGGLVVASTTGSGFTATGGGTVTVSGAGNTIATGAGVALSVENTTSGGLEFRSISSNGGSAGIVMNNTGLGGLTVTGNSSGACGGVPNLTGSTGAPGAPVTADCSGGTIQNIAGADGDAAGNAVYLVNARNISLTRMHFATVSNNGIYASDVDGLTVAHSAFTGSIGTSNGAPYNESPLRFVNVSGSINVTNSTLNGGAMNALRLDNTAPVNPTVLVENVVVSNMQGSVVDVRGTALLVNALAGTANVTIRNNQVTFWWGNAIHVLVHQNATGTASISGNVAYNTNGALAAAGGIWVAGGNLQYSIANNRVRYTNGAAISADRTGPGAHMQGTIENNLIGNSGEANSGSWTGIGIFASATGPNPTTVRIRNNTLRQINGSASGAITVVTGDHVTGGGQSVVNATISGNNIQESGTTVNNAQHGILITHDRTGGDATTACYDILNNSITNFVSGVANNRIRVNQRFLGVSRFPGYVGANNDNAALGSYLLGRNTASTFANVNNVTAGGSGFTNTIPAGAPCAQPVM